MNLTPDHTRLMRQFVSYAFRDMARLCATHGWNEGGCGTQERLQNDLTPSLLGYRRGMVVGRQLFYFPHAYRLTADPLYKARAEHLFEDLTTHFWDDENGGWYFSLGEGNDVADSTKDLYGHAFILFGLAHYFAIFQDDRALEWVRRTHDIVQERFSLPGGWLAPAATREWNLLGRNLEQNPHMHLLEAYLSLFNATRDDAFLDCARRIMAVYTEKLRTPDRHKVLEHLDERGEATGEKGTLIQPGHLYEWYWLVNEYADAAEVPELKTDNGLTLDWADEHCVDESEGGLFDLVNSSADILSDRKRIWPTTEQIKAYATRLRENPTEEAREKLMGPIGFILDNYLQNDGSWHEFLNRQLAPDSDFMPLSTPYHVAMAALEVERLLGGPGAFGMTASDPFEFE